MKQVKLRVVYGYIYIYMKIMIFLYRASPRFELALNSYQTKDHASRNYDLPATEGAPNLRVALKPC